MICRVIRHGRFSCTRLGDGCSHIIRVNHREVDDLHVCCSDLHLAFCIRFCAADHDIKGPLSSKLLESELYGQYNVFPPIHFLET